MKNHGNFPWFSNVLIINNGNTVFSYDTFKSLTLGERKLTRDQDFSICPFDGSVCITLSGSFLDTLLYGEYRFTAEFLYVKNVTLLLKLENPHRTGDVDGDSEVTIVDATYIQRFLASLPVSEAIGKPVKKS